MSLFNLFCVAGVFISVSESDEAIAASIDVQTCLVGDSHSPHKSPIKAAAKTLPTSHFQFLRSVGGSFKDQPTISVLVSFQGRVAWHFSQTRSAAEWPRAGVFRVRP